MNIVDELLLKGGVKLSIVCVCLFSNRCCQRNVYTHSDHSHCFEHSLWGVQLRGWVKEDLCLYLFI